MKVVHINSADCGTGSAIACARHCEAMIQSGVESSMLVTWKRTKKSYVSSPKWGVYEKLRTPFRILHNLLVRNLNPTGTFSYMSFGMPIYKSSVLEEADVIFIHWVNGNSLSIEGVEKILRLGKPTYWYMHDMFPITGGCHHSFDCEGYKDSCKNCPLIKNKKMRGLASRQFKKKIDKWGNYSNLSFITPSTWLGKLVSESRLASGHKVYVVPNVINTQIFSPLGVDAKKVFGLDKNKKTILFGAAMDTLYKGSNFAHDCLKSLDPEKYEGLVIGQANPDFTKDLRINVVTTGFLSDEIALSMAYNACDTFIISSIAENYPNVVLEAMACGKPCVGFRTGGIPDLIHHNESGYLTEEKSTKALIDGIEWLFEDTERYTRLANEARNQVLANNAYGRVMEIHTELKQ